MGKFQLGEEKTNKKPLPPPKNPTAVKEFDPTTKGDNPPSASLGGGAAIGQLLGAVVLVVGLLGHLLQVLHVCAETSTQRHGNHQRQTLNNADTDLIHSYFHCQGKLELDFFFIFFYF